jgi:hypothetical protein
VRYLKTIGLRIRVGYAETEGWELACNCEQNTQARIEMNARGIVLKAELEEGGEILIRAGQCWEYEGRALEILGFRDERIEIMEWEHERSITAGQEMEVKEGSRPQGMGRSIMIGRKEFIKGKGNRVKPGETRGFEDDIVSSGSLTRLRGKGGVTPTTHKYEGLTLQVRSKGMNFIHDGGSLVTPTLVGTQIIFEFNA